MDQERIDAAWKLLEGLKLADLSALHSTIAAVLDLRARLEALEQVERDRQTQIAEDSWYDIGGAGI
jgi:hypothetical protein